MTKSEIVAAMQAQLDGTSKDAAIAVNLIFDTITTALASGESVLISRFGRFAVAEHKARIGHNVKTGEKMHIPATLRVKFKASRELKSALRSASKRG